MPMVLYSYWFSANFQQQVQVHELLLQIPSNSAVDEMPEREDDLDGTTVGPGNLLYAINGWKQIARYGLKTEKYLVRMIMVQFFAKDPPV
eukprot:946626_1